jgi:hypothetical protein
VNHVFLGEAKVGRVAELEVCGVAEKVRRIKGRVASVCLGYTLYNINS